MDQYLVSNGLMGSCSRIYASIPEGVPENGVHIASENCRTLRFTTHGIEKQ
jgi:hypothetical protein